MDRQQMRKKKKKKRRIKFIVFPLILILLGTVGFGSYLTYKLANASSKAQETLSRGEKSNLRLNAIDPGKDNFSVLIAGIDDSKHRKGKKGFEGNRTDALILATFNREQKSVKMVSIPRDSYVQIPGRINKDKITHAHAFGGIDLTVDTVEHLFNLPVDYYVRVNFDAFLQIVDTLGGVDVDVKKKIVEQDSQDRPKAITIEPGKQRLNPEEALAYARTRHADSDIMRGDRQKQIVEAIIKESTQIKSIPKYGQLIENIGDNMSTNFTLGNMIALLKYAKSVNNIESLSLKGNDSRINNIYYYSLDDQSVLDISNKLKEHLDYSGTGTTDTNSNSSTDSTAN
ncbi:transcriptional attenuator, LytR family [Fictibacillus solisalsi]|uniref:Transcriptional attenuator, LytR family n=1 Tax=Fictibacillus solisalsi TaxID=459525 RepID=A0A1G9Y0S0_9BACL|nr:LCP family protein [Fictibacillus solisalsi]SDN02709.1 transcriptional attenuator, LytR family [Fictibacillus solisalsi]